MVKSLDFGLVKKGILHAINSKDFKALDHFESIIIELLKGVRNLILTNSSVCLSDLDLLKKAKRLFFLTISLTN